MSAQISFWLSKIQVDFPIRKTGLRHYLHKLIWLAFPNLPHGQNQPFLYTITDDINHNGIGCLAQSAEQPDWEIAQAQEKPLKINPLHGSK